MKPLVLSLPLFGIAVATRAMIGAGIALLVSNRLTAERRQRVGVSLLMIGAAATVPIVRAVIRDTEAARLQSPAM
jgi:hypothetical protein